MDLKKIKTFEALKLAKHNFFSGNNSPIKKLQQQIKSASQAEKIKLGKELSSLKQSAIKAFANKVETLKLVQAQAKLVNQWVDIAMPVDQIGSSHPLTLIANLAREWLQQHGYFETKLSEIETDSNNFSKLNIPQHHPAREMQDTFYIDDKLLLRTHNTSVISRVLQQFPNQKLATFAIGKVFRNDDDDEQHSHQFTQIDLVCLGQVTIANLIWTIKQLINYILEKKVQFKIRTSYFPFTEPSIEVDIWHQNKWVEVLGAGILHHNLFKLAKWTIKTEGFAIGIGLERLAMIKYDIDDIREFYKNNLRFLNQFKGSK